jgi:hypothetical protein
MAVAAVVLLAGCSGSGWIGPGGPGKKSDADVPGEITKPIGPHLVARCPVPITYDDATTHKIQQELNALPKDSALRKAMSDYEAERDNLRMCQ